MDDDKVAEALVRQVWKADLEVASVRKIRQAVVAELGLDPEFFAGPWKEESRHIVDKAVNMRYAEERRKSQDGETSSIFVEKGDMSRERPEDKPSPEEEIKTEAPDGLILESPIRSGPNESPYSKQNGSSEIEESSKSNGSPKKGKRRADSSPVKVEKKVKVEGRKRKDTPKTQEEIARLKSQLLKCGIRRQWAKVLDPMGSDRERIKYLKNQLALLGMTGRFSLEKARKIKEAREFEQEMKDLNADADRLLHRSSSPAEPATRRKRAIIDDEEDD